MIRVVKQQPGPAVLQTRGRPARDALCDAHDRGRRDFPSEEFDRSVYAAPDVRAALVAAQFGKCAFCESKVMDVSYGDVEHYRPKAAFRQRDTLPLGRPGYYWLAYEWDNLFLACVICNQRFKGNTFPLAVQRDRARNHRDNLARERPLLLDPSGEPEQHIVFVGEMAAPRNRSRRGAVTIDLVGLNRPEVLELRLERFRTLRLLRDSAVQLARRLTATPDPVDQTLLAETQAALLDAVRPAAEYSAMARAFLR